MTTGGDGTLPCVNHLQRVRKATLDEFPRHVTCTQLRSESPALCHVSSHLHFVTFRVTCTLSRHLHFVTFRVTCTLSRHLHFVTFRVTCILSRHLHFVTFRVICTQPRSESPALCHVPSHPHSVMFPVTCTLLTFRVTCTLSRHLHPALLQSASVRCRQRNFVPGRVPASQSVSVRSRSCCLWL